MQVFPLNGSNKGRKWLNVLFIRQLSSLDTLEDKNAGKPEQSLSKQKSTPVRLLTLSDTTQVTFFHI